MLMLGADEGMNEETVAATVNRKCGKSTLTTEGFPANPRQLSKVQRCTLKASITPPQVRAQSYHRSVNEKDSE